MSARETGAVEPTETGIDAGIEAILAKDDTAIMLDELREILGADIDVDSRFTIAQMLTVMERCFKDGEAWNRMIERAKAAALSRPQPTPAGEIVERLNRKIESVGAWMTSDLRAFYTDLRDHIEQQAATIAELREALEAVKPLVDAAHGLSFGTDWNNGTAAKTHGYRRKLLKALPKARATLERRGQ